MKSTRQNQKVKLTTEKCDLANALVGSGQVFNNPTFKIEMKSPLPHHRQKIFSRYGDTGFAGLLIIAVIVISLTIVAVKTDRRTFSNIASFLNQLTDFMALL